MEDRITIDPSICNGRPVVRGTRITDQTVLVFSALGIPSTMSWRNTRR